MSQLSLPTVSSRPKFKLTLCYSAVILSMAHIGSVQAATVTSNTDRADSADVASTTTNEDMENNDQSTNDAMPSVTLDTIVVTTSRSELEQAKAPQTIEVINEAQISDQLKYSTNSSEVLSKNIVSYTPSTGGMSGYGETLRGRTPLVLVDGIPQSTPLRPSGREYHTIDFGAAESIEVIQGANATNGSNASGGVINVKTRQPTSGALNQHAAVQATVIPGKLNSDTTSYRARYGFDGIQDNVDYLFDATVEDQGISVSADDKLISTYPLQGDLADSFSYNLLGKLGYAIDDNQYVQASVNHYHIENHLDYTPVLGNPFTREASTAKKGKVYSTEKPENEVTSVGLTYKNADLFGMSLDTLAFYQDYKATFGEDNSPNYQDPSLAPQGELYDQTQAITKKIGLKSTLQKESLFDLPLDMTVGLDAIRDKSRQDLILTERTYMPEATYTSYEPFVQLQSEPIDGVILHGGARHTQSELSVDDYTTVAKYNNTKVKGGSRDYDETLYNYGVTLTPTDWVTLFGSYSEAFSVPDVGRALRTLDGSKVDTTEIDSLDIFKPIITENVEVGTRFHMGPANLNLSYFKSTSDYNERPQYNNGLRTYEIKREKTKIDGYELGFDYQLSDQHKISVGYLDMDGKRDSDGDGSLDLSLLGDQLPPNRYLASWDAKWSDKVSTNLQVERAMSRDYYSPLYTDYYGLNINFDGYTLVDAAVNYKLKKGTATVAVSNLLNEDYLRFSSQTIPSDSAESFVKGQGRAVTVGYSVDF